MKKIIATTLILSLVFLGFGVLAVGAHGGGSPHGNMNNNVNQSTTYQQSNENGLVLEDEQTEEIAVLHEKYFYQREELVESLRNKRNELRAAILKNESVERITTIENEIDTLQEQVNVAQKEYLKNMKDILNEEQLNMIIEEDYRMGLGNRTFGRGVRSFSNNRKPMHRLGSGHIQVNGSFNGYRSNIRSSNRGFCF